MPTHISKFKPDGLANIYSGFTSAFTPASAPTDIFEIRGGAGRVISVLKFIYSPVQTVSNIDTISLKKRSTLNTGGGVNAVTKVPLDSSSPASVATVQFYTTTNPTIGTLVGNVWAARVDTPALATSGMGGFIGVVLDLVEILGHPIRLNTANESLCLSHDTAVLPAGHSVHAGFIWSEI